MAPPKDDPPRVTAVPAPGAPALVPARTESLRSAPAPKLTLRFAVYGAVALLVSAALGLWIARQTATENAREEAYADTQTIAQRLAGDDLASLALAGPARGDLVTDLDELFLQQTLDDAIVRVTLFDRNASITYSTQHALIGAQGDKARILPVLEGEESFGKTKLEDGSEVMESSVPVRWLLADSEFTNGVLAVHHDYDVVAKEIRDDTLLQASTMAFALLLLYAASFPILRRVTATLEDRNRLLVEQAAALRLSESQYRLIVETAAEGVWLLDTLGRGAFVNEKLADLLGYAPIEIVNRPLTDFLDSSSKNTLDEDWLRRRYSRGEERDLVLVHKDGSPVYATVLGNPVEDDGAYLGTLLMLTDVTRDKHIAHDFSNAIMTISGYSDLLLARLAEDDPRRREVEQMRRAADAAAELTQQILRREA